MISTITISIDGKEIITEPGKTILQAAIDSGLYIPYLCYYPGMKPFGACRMCVVEVENVRGTPASCTTPVADGMIVHTNNENVNELRKGITELIISEHPHGCLTCHRTDLGGANLCGPEDICLRHVSVTDRCVSCPKNERCELKDTTIYVGTGLTTPLNYKYRNLPVLSQDPFYDLDYNLCIVCGRCVRACEELRGDSAITFTERAGIALVGPANGSSLLESGCEFCGSCIDVCPVGALVESDYKWEKAVENISTTCPHCPVGCQLKIEVNKRGKVIRAIPELEADANHGQACFKGKFGLDFVNSRSRLKTPMIRRDGSLQPASWEDAISLIAEKLTYYKGHSFAALGSEKGTNEENYLLQKLVRSGMGTNNVDYSSNLKPEMIEPLMDALGYQAATESIWDLEKSECILVLGTNVTEEQNVAAVPIKRAVQNGSNLIVIDPREVELTRYASIWLRPKPGTDAIVVAGLLRVIVDEVLEDEQFLKDNCENLDSLKNSLWRFDLNKVEDVTGIAKDDIRNAARMFAGSGAASIIYALDTVSRAQYRDCASAVVNLALITGNMGKQGAGIIPLRSGTNAQGSWDVGCVPHLLPGYRNVDDSDARLEIIEAWGSAPDTKGLGVTDVFGAIDAGDVKAMLVIGDSPNFYNGELGDVLESAGKLDFLVVQDVFLNGLGEIADVVLPSATFAEKEGTYTSLERRVQPLRKVLELQNTQAMPDWWILCQIAQAMGMSGFTYHCPAEILDEIAKLVWQYSGITYQRMVAQQEVDQLILVPSFPLPSQLQPSNGGRNFGVQWPCVSLDDVGTQSLYTEGFPNGSARFIPLEMNLEDDIELPTTDEYPLLLVPGRVLHQSQRQMEISLHEKKNHIQREEVIEIGRTDASTFGVVDGDTVEITSSRESISGILRVEDEVFTGTIRTTSLFGELATDLDGSDNPDPMSYVPTLALKPVKLSKITA